MYGSVSPGNGIADQDGNAIRCFHSYELARQVRNESVESFLGSRRCPGRIYHLDLVAVNLPDGRKSKPRLKKRQKSSPVFAYILRRIVIESGKIEVLRRKRRDAAESCRKAISETCIFQRLTNKQPKSALPSPIEARFC